MSEATLDRERTERPTGGPAGAAGASGLSGRQKAAVLLISLGAERAANVLKHLGEREVESLSAEMAALWRVRPETSAAVMREVEERLTSNDVIHAFYVPSFLFKRDVVPGHVNEFDLSVEATWAGQVIHGQCAELCGIGHDIMLFDVSIQSPADFKAWYDQKVAEAQASPPPPPSGEPGGSGAPPPQGGGTVLDVVAKNVQFDVKELTAPANQPFTIHFDNQDAGTPHDVDILDSAGKKVEDNKDFNGVATMDYQEKPLPAGTYKFECSIHPTIMFGTLTVQ